MDDHHPGGILWPGEPTIFHPAPSPFGIPYRCLYSRDIDNLWCAGRNISVTHAAMSSSRVMATCALVGQAAGTAAAVAAQYQLTPRGVYQQRIQELKQALMEDDCYLPWNTRAVPLLSREAGLRASQVNRCAAGWTAPLAQQTTVGKARWGIGSSMLSMGLNGSSRFAWFSTAT
jgi:hypothetical protein